MPMISYSQHGEDVLLNRLFPGDHRGFYVDIGANHPTIDSVTRHFYDHGWRGVNIEPVARVFEELRAGRPRDVNLQLALSDREGSLILHEPRGSLGMATLDPEFARGLREHGYDYDERRVPVSTLSTICDLYVGDATIDFLKIDVEGHEDAVVRGGDWRRWRPRVVVVEATIGPGRWEPVLLEADYLLAASDGINRYYLRSEDADLRPRLAAPVWLTDSFIPFRVAEELRDLEEQLRGTREGLEHARFTLWETRQRLAQSEARERAATEELDRLRMLVTGSDRPAARSAIARRISAALRRVPAGRPHGRRAG